MIDAAAESPGSSMQEQNKKKKDFEIRPLINPKYVKTVKLLISEKNIKDANINK